MGGGGGWKRWRCEQGFLADADNQETNPQAIYHHLLRSTDCAKAEAHSPPPRTPPPRCQDDSRKTDRAKCRKRPQSNGSTSSMHQPKCPFKSHKSALSHSRASSQLGACYGSYMTVGLYRHRRSGLRTWCHWMLLSFQPPGVGSSLRWLQGFAAVKRTRQAPRPLASETNFFCALQGSVRSLEIGRGPANLDKSRDQASRSEYKPHRAPTRNMGHHIRYVTFRE